MSKKLIERADEYAKEKHKNQFRKYTNEPYIVHPRAVAADVKRIPGSTKEMVAAALLHDTVEDTDATIYEIKFLFGLLVSNYVEFLTDVSSEGESRANRMIVNNQRLSKAPGSVQSIKLCDSYDNCESIVRHDPKFAPFYLEEKKVQMLSLTRGNEMVYNRLKYFINENLK